MKNTITITRQQLKRCHSEGSIMTTNKDNEIQIDLKPIIYVLIQMAMAGEEE